MQNAVPEDLVWVVVLAGLCMAVMAFAIGANDLANAFGPAFGAKSLTVKQVCCLAAVCESSGAILMGGFVSNTIPGKLISMDMYEGDDGRVLIMIGMMSALLAASFWLMVASRFGLPVSTTHAIVGCIIAFACITKGYASANWEKVTLIVASWFVSPVLASFVGFSLYTILHHMVLKHADSARRAHLAGPVFVFIVTFVVALFIVYKGGKGLGLNKTSPEVAIAISAGIAGACSILAYPLLTFWEKRERARQSPASEATPGTPQDDLEKVDVGRQAPANDAMTVSPQDTPVALDVPECCATVEQDDIKMEEKVEIPKHSHTERLFSGFVVVIGGFFSLAHGANDVANAIGPFGAALAAFEGPLPKKLEIPVQYYVAAAAFIVLGLLTFGRQVMETLGKKITVMTPSKAFTVNFSATMCALVATRAGIPVSTTHLSVGAVVGVGVAFGMANPGQTESKEDSRRAGLKSVNWKLLAKVFSSWIFTLPLTGITAAGIFGLLLPTVVSVPHQ